MIGLFATFFEKKVAPKNFQREVFSAYSTFDVCIAIIDCFLGSSRAPTPTILVDYFVCSTDMFKIGRGGACSSQKNKQI